MSVFAPLFAAFAPFILWPIELIFPSPYILEELAKALLVFWILKTPAGYSRWQLVILSGLLFAISESALYTFNINLSGQVSVLIKRLLFTIPLHVATISIIYYFFLKKRKIAFVGIFVAMAIHFFYNYLVATKL